MSIAVFLTAQLPLLLNQLFQLRQLVIIQPCREGRKSGYQMVFAFTDKIAGNILDQMSDEFFPADLSAIIVGMPLLLTREQIFFEQSVQSALYGIECATSALG
tara:strand:+ start:605 stop:913 length:309 start_codon:yes stop_codon:yes gene_type:complete